MEKEIEPNPTANHRMDGKEIFKIKLALSSLTNTVVVCPMRATLYTQSPTDDETWIYCKRGAPGLILSHDGNREITCAQLCIADPDSGFALWRETLRDSSNYKSTQKNFHTFRILSGGINSMAGIRFPTDESASAFLRDVLSSIPKGEPRAGSPINKGPHHKFSLRKIRKEEISTPCMFKHVMAGSTQNNKHRERSRTVLNRDSRSKGNKYSGSGSSLDAPDSDPSQDLTTRRSFNVHTGKKR